MEVCLVQNQVISLRSQSVSNLARFSVNARIPKTWRNLQKAVEAHSVNKIWPLEFQLKVDKLVEMMEVEITGDFLRILHDVVFLGDLKETLRLKVTLKAFGVKTVYRNRKRVTKEICLGSVDVNEFRGKVTHNQVLNHGVYHQTNIPVILNTFHKMNSKVVRISVTISVFLDHFVSLATILPPPTPSNLRLLQCPTELSDICLVSSDGHRVPCHKIFLSQSPVFSAMMLKQTQTENGDLHIPELSFEGVQALLEYLYCGQVYKLLKSAKLCLELFEAGWKYQLPVLEQVARTIFMEMPIEWIELPVALKLWTFLRNFKKEDEWERILKDKVVQVLLRWMFSQLINIV